GGSRPEELRRRSRDGQRRRLRPQSPVRISKPEGSRGRQEHLDLHYRADQAGTASRRTGSASASQADRCRRHGFGSAKEARLERDRRNRRAVNTAATQMKKEPSGSFFIFCGSMSSAKSSSDYAALRSARYFSRRRTASCKFSIDVAYDKRI